MQILKILFITAFLVLVAISSAWVASVNKDFSEFFNIIHETAFSDNTAGGVLFKNRSAMNQLLVKENKGSSVTMNKIQQPDDGYILYTGHTTEAYLVDRNGEELYSWSKPFTEVWPDAQHAFKPHIQDENIYWMDAFPTKEGDLYVNYERPFAFPSGFGFAKLDKDSNLIWKYSANTHHWFDVVEELNRVYVLENEIANSVDGKIDKLKRIILDDYVVILDSETGKLIDRFSIQEAFRNSDYRAFLDMFYQKRDRLHSNKVTYIDSSLAEKLPVAAEGDILVGLRNVNAVAVIDGEKKTVKWSFVGPWYRQHDPDILDNGNLLVFDNRSQSGPEGTSRIVEYDIIKHKIAWSYRGTKQDPFSSDIRGLQQKLDNGNVLIVSSGQGRVFEVTPEGEVVWEFYNMHEVNGQQSTIGTGKFFSRDYFEFIK